jgi:tetratricopeptide (TPR) repeat protein
VINGPEDIARHVVPRWRFFTDTASTGDLAGSGIASRKLNGIEKLRATWSVDQNVISAGELVMAAAVAGEQAVAVDAAEYLIDHTNGAAPGLVYLAEKLIGATSGNEHELVAPSGEVYGDIIRACRMRLALHPKDAISWTDLARAHFSLGAEGKAAKALNIALRLAPNNRFVLRAVSRFKIHQKKFDEAHDLLNASPRTRTDPWLMAGEMACATLAARSPKTSKYARRILEDENFAPRAVAELAAEYGTLELQSGKRREARKLFGKALTDPNENALAQVEWAAKSKVAPEITVEQLNLPFAYEVAQGVEYRLRNWHECLRYPRLWIDDEPFSSKPAGTASFVAMAMLGDAKGAAEFARLGLKRSPKDPWLLNNLAVSLARQGRVVEAADTVRKISFEDADFGAKVVNVATRGLILFRAGAVEEGRKLYEYAIKAANSARQISLARRAQMNLIYEEFCRDPLRANEYLSEISKLSRLQPDPEADCIRNRIQLLANARTEPASGANSTAVQWVRSTSPWAKLESIDPPVLVHGPQVGPKLGETH